VQVPDDLILLRFLPGRDFPGIYDVSLWLVDELGNEDPATRQTGSIQLDNVPPNEFLTHGPTSDEWAPPQPRFYFDDAGDLRDIYDTNLPNLKQVEPETQKLIYDLEN